MSHATAARRRRGFARTGESCRRSRPDVFRGLAPRSGTRIPRARELRRRPAFGLHRCLTIQKGQTSCSRPALVVDHVDGAHWRSSERAVEDICGSWPEGVQFAVSATTCRTVWRRRVVVVPSRGKACRSALEAGPRAQRCRDGRPRARRKRSGRLRSRRPFGDRPALADASQLDCRFVAAAAEGPLGEARRAASTTSGFTAAIAVFIRATSSFGR